MSLNKQSASYYIEDDTNHRVCSSTKKVRHIGHEEIKEFLIGARISNT